MKSTYLVTAAAYDLAGWTPETLAAALRGPLETLGVDVVVKEHQHGYGELSMDDSTPWPDCENLGYFVRRAVDRVIANGG